jgi:hypothetical protein
MRMAYQCAASGALLLESLATLYKVVVILGSFGSWEM